MSVRFGDLPPGVRSPKMRMWADESAELRSRPNEWALLTVKLSPVGAYQMANSVRQAGLSAFRPRGTFDAVSHGCEVWARYIGAASGGPS